VPTTRQGAGASNVKLPSWLPDDGRTLPPVDQAPLFPSAWSPELYKTTLQRYFAQLLKYYPRADIRALSHRVAARYSDHAAVDLFDQWNRGAVFNPDGTLSQAFVDNYAGLLGPKTEKVIDEVCTGLQKSSKAC